MSNPAPVYRAELSSVHHRSHSTTKGKQTSKPLSRGSSSGLLCHGLCSLLGLRSSCSLRCRRSCLIITLGLATLVDGLGAVVAGAAVTAVPAAFLRAGGNAVARYPPIRCDIAFAVQSSR
jgi:hypothetical protein